MIVTCPCCGKVFEVDEDGVESSSIDISADVLEELGVLFGVAEGGVSIEG